MQMQEKVELVAVALCNIVQVGGALGPQSFCSGIHDSGITNPFTRYSNLLKPGD